MRQALAALRARKDDIERRMNALPQKGRQQAVVRREQAEAEGQLDELNQKIEKIHFQLTKFREE